MKLKALKVHGFKSFADSTEIEFHGGITAVVGPNGCGKSNISDAIRWVLGEQRPTAIRGAKMEEAIFQGSLNRRPVNRGSVSLVVSNSPAGSLHIVCACNGKSVCEQLEQLVILLEPFENDFRSLTEEEESVLSASGE